MTSVKYHCFNSMKNVPDLYSKQSLPLALLSPSMKLFGTCGGWREWGQDLGALLSLGRTPRTCILLFF